MELGAGGATSPAWTRALLQQELTETLGRERAREPFLCFQHDSGLLDPGLFSVVRKTLIIIPKYLGFLHSRSSTFRTVCLNPSRSALVRIKEKMIAQAAGF